MVDFQERDTTRGLDELGEDDESAPDQGATEPDAEDATDSHEHDEEGGLGVAVLTISSSRTIEEDASGDAIVAAVEDAGYGVATRELVGDDHDRIQQTVDALTRRDDVDIVVSTGGTGVTPDDVTVESVRPLLDKHLPGFGELFRRRSESEIGTRVVATRATGGIAEDVPVFCLPGSEDAVRLGTTEIILPEAPHLVSLARGEGHGHHDE